MANEIRATLYVQAVLEGQEGKTFNLYVKAFQREGIQLEVRISLLGDFASGKSSLVGHSLN